MILVRFSQSVCVSLLCVPTFGLLTGETPGTFMLSRLWQQFSFGSCKQNDLFRKNAFESVRPLIRLYVQQFSVRRSQNILSIPENSLKIRPRPAELHTHTRSCVSLISVGSELTPLRRVCVCARLHAVVETRCQSVSVISVCERRDSYITTMQKESQVRAEKKRPETSQ